MNNLLALQKTTHPGEDEDLDVQPPIVNYFISFLNNMSKTISLAYCIKP